MQRLNILENYIKSSEAEVKFDSLRKILIKKKCLYYEEMDVSEKGYDLQIDFICIQRI